MKKHTDLYSNTLIKENYIFQKDDIINRNRGNKTLIKVRLDLLENLI